MTDKSIHELFDDSWYDSGPLRTMRTMESTFLSNLSNLNGFLVFIDLIKADVTLRGLVQHHDEYKSHLLLYHGVHLPRPKPPQMSFTRSRIPLIQPIYWSLSLQIRRPKRTDGVVQFSSSKWGKRLLALNGCCDDLSYYYTYHLNKYIASCLPGLSQVSRTIFQGSLANPVITVVSNYTRELSIAIKIATRR